LHCTLAAQAGAHIATVPFKILAQMAEHPLTTSGVARFKADWEKIGK
jgi:transaldolase